MLKDTLQAFHKVEASQNHEQNTQMAVRLFNEYLYFMLDSQRFPNREINLLSEFVLNLVTDEHFLFIFPKQEELYGHMLVTLDHKGIKESARLYVPNNFVDEVAQTPERQVGVIASVLSQCRDYFCGKYNAQEDENIRSRALACQAEALHTLQKLAKREKVSLDLSDFQKWLLTEFAYGLASLDEWLWYPTPKYRTTFSPPKGERNNN
jgi:hypothetical protein